MTTLLIWTEMRDTVLCDLRAEGRSWDAIAAVLGISRWAAVERGRLLGARRPPPTPKSRKAAVTGREPLPPGDPASWGALIAGTLLDGAAYPYPPMLPVEEDDKWGGRAAELAA